MAIIPSKKEEEADDMRLRISSFSGKKTDRAVEKGLITKYKRAYIINLIPMKRQ